MYTLVRQESISKYDVTCADKSLHNIFKFILHLVKDVCQEEMITKSKTLSEELLLWNFYLKNLHNFVLFILFYISPPGLLQVVTTRIKLEDDLDTRFTTGSHNKHKIGRRLGHQVYYRKSQQA